MVSSTSWNKTRIFHTLEPNVLACIHALLSLDGALSGTGPSPERVKGLYHSTVSLTRVQYMTEFSQALDFMDIKSHPLLGRGRSCNSCTDAQHNQCFQPFFPTRFGERLGENVGSHLVGFAVLHLAQPELVGNVVQPAQADVMTSL